MVFRDYFSLNVYAFDVSAFAPSALLVRKLVMSASGGRFAATRLDDFDTQCASLAHIYSSALTVQSELKRLAEHRLESLTNYFFYVFCDID